MSLLSRREMLAITGMSIAYGIIHEPFVTRTVKSSSPLPRMPLDEFVQSASLLSALRKGVTEMKKRKPSDPLSWFYQAAIHGVTDEAIKTDPSFVGSISLFNHPAVDIAHKHNNADGGQTQT